ncbi:unnamed protein product [Phaeothamnion confervicola]
MPPAILCLQCVLVLAFLRRTSHLCLPFFCLISRLRAFFDLSVRPAICCGGCCGGGARTEPNKIKPKPVAADLSQIKLRAEQLNYYTSHDMLKADLLLMVNNCKRYNKPETDYYKCAVEVEGLIEECFRPDSAEAAAANRKTASAAAQQQQR